MLPLVTLHYYHFASIDIIFYPFLITRTAPLTQFLFDASSDKPQPRTIAHLTQAQANEKPAGTACQVSLKHNTLKAVTQAFR